MSSKGHKGWFLFHQLCGIIAMANTSTLEKLTKDSLMSLTPTH